MHLLSCEDHGTLLKLLFGCDSQTFTALHAGFRAAFTTHASRYRACCATLLLLEDSRALSTAQRLGSWYLIHGNDGLKTAEGGPATDTSARSPERNPFAPYLLEVAGDSRRSTVERSLVAQLLLGRHVQQLESLTPLDYALSYSLPVSSSNDDLAPLRALLQAGPPLATSQHLDSALAAQRHTLLEVAATQAGGAELAAAGTGGLHPNGKGAAGALAGSPDGPAPPALLKSRLPTDGLKPGTLAALSARPGPTSHPISSDQGSSGGHPASHTSDVTDVEVQGLSEARLAQVKQLVERALSGPLLPSQQQVVLAALADDPHALAKCGVNPAQLPRLVEHTPTIASELLLRMATLTASASSVRTGTPSPPGASTSNGAPSAPVSPAAAALNEYLGVLAASEMSLHSMEVVNKLATSAPELPGDFLHVYVSNCIHSCEAAQDKYVQSRLVRLLCVFLQSLIRNRALPIADLMHEVQSFCVDFSRIREAAKLFRLLKQMESGSRLLGSSDSPGSPTSGTPGGEASPAFAGTPVAAAAGGGGARGSG